MENPKTAMRLMEEMKRAGVDEESEMIQKSKWEKGKKISTLVSMSDMASLKNTLSNRNNQGKNGFNNTNAEITKRDSSKGTYTSISIKVNMKSPDAVIEKYKKVSKVEGVISL